MRNSSYSFIPILLKLYRCCDHALKICMWFGYNPQINFCHFFRNLNLAIFRAFSQWKWMGSGYLVCATPPTVSCQFKLNMCYGHGLKICMWFGCNPWIIFCHFFSQFELSHFFGHFSEWIEGTLCAQLLQFNTDTFETLQTLWPCFEDMHVVGIYSSD